MAASYYNTTNTYDRELAEFDNRASRQEKVILAYLRERPAFRGCPHTIRDNVFGQRPVLVTSVRRALSNLVKAGLAVKHEKRVEGRHGVAVCTWSAKREPLPSENQIDLFEQFGETA